MERPILCALLLAACGENSSTDPGEVVSTPTVDVARTADPDSDPSGVRFVARAELFTAGFPSGLATTDLDGDGRQDLVATFERPGRLALWPSSAGGLEAEPRQLEIGAWALPPAPRDHDDGASVVWASRDTRRVADVGIGANGPRSRGEAELTESPRALAVAPVDAPTPVRIAVVCDRSLALLDSTGELLVAPLDDVRATCAAITSDDSALWVGDQSGRRLLRFDLDADALAGLGPDPVTADRTIELDGIPRAIVISDVDQDGDEELCVYGGDESVWLFGIGDDDGAEGWGAAAPVTVRAPGLVPLAAVAVDLDGDGPEELVSIHAYDTSYGVLGRFDPSVGRFRLRASEYAGQTPVSLAVADFDDDGRADLAIANRDAQRISVLPGTGLAVPEKEVFYEARRTATATNPLGVATGDLDGDGALDAVSANGSAGSLTLAFNRFGLLSETREVSIGPSPVAVRITDIDRDGVNDLVALVRPAGRARLAIRRGLGDGDFGETENLDLAGDAARLELVDLSGDGAPDLVACDPTGGRVVVVEIPATPSPAWTPTVATHDLGPAPNSIAGLEASAGGALLAVTHAGPQPFVSVHALREGRWAELMRAPLAGHGVELAAGDFDADGQTDVAVLSRRSVGDPSGFVEPFLRRGDVLMPLPKQEIGLAASEVIAVDLDRDGRDDLALAAQNTHNVNVLLATANGFQRYPDLGAGLGCLGVASGDLNADGRPDLIVANAFSHDLSTIYVLPSR
ncbi:MAG: FG-GAP repeat domain-containing protein [Planctomycetota bacterium]|jgi:hypothetical protein